MSGVHDVELLKTAGRQLQLSLKNEAAMNDARLKASGMDNGERRMKRDTANG